jgi:hypothetical protein
MTNPDTPRYIEVGEGNHTVLAATGSAARVRALRTALALPSLLK